MADRYIKEDTSREPTIVIEDITVELVKKLHKTFETAEGEVVVAPGNYIATRKDGTKFGITPEDLKLYRKVK